MIHEKLPMHYVPRLSLDYYMTLLGKNKSQRPNSLRNLHYLSSTGGTTSPSQLASLGPAARISSENGDKITIAD